MDEFEPLIQGSPLFEYIHNSVKMDDEDIVNYESTPKLREEPLLTIDSPKKLIPENLKVCVDLITQSKLLLEDDLNILLQATCDIVPQNNKLMYLKVSSISLLVFFAVMAIAYFRDLSLELLLCSVIPVAITPYQYIKKRKIINEVASLIENLKATLFFIKKILAEVKINDEITESVRIRKRMHMCLRIEESSQPKEITSLAHSTMNCVQSLLVSIRKATCDLIIEAPLISTVDSMTSYCALMRDDELGIAAEESSLLSYHMKHVIDIYIVMQSELLRRLALGFCPFLWRTSSQEMKTSRRTINFLFKQSKEAKDTLSRLFSNFFYRHQVNEASGMQNSIISDVQIILHQFSATLRRVLSTVQQSESLLERNPDVLESEHVFELLSFAESALQKSLEDLGRIKKMVRFKKTSASPELTPEESEESKDNPIHLNCTHARVQDLIDPQGDKVYFGISEETNVLIKSNDGFDLDQNHQYPCGLLEELKTRLLEKSEEFDEREFATFHDENERREFKSFLEALQVPTPEREKEEPNFDEVSFPFFTLQRDIAAIIASKVESHKKKEEETFGDSSESGDET